MKKVKIFHDCELDKISYQYPEGDWPYGERFVLRLKDGRTIREEQLFVLGAARRPLSMAHVEKKFRACASSSGFPSDRTEELIHIVEKVEVIGSISEMLGGFLLDRAAVRTKRTRR